MAAGSSNSTAGVLTQTPNSSSNDDSMSVLFVYLYSTYWGLHIIIYNNNNNLRLRYAGTSASKAT